MDDAVYHTRTKYVIFSKQHAVVLNGRLRLRNCLGVDPMSLGDLDSLPYEYSRLHKSSQRSPKHR